MAPSTTAVVCVVLATLLAVASAAGSPPFNPPTTGIQTFGAGWKWNKWLWGGCVWDGTQFTCDNPTWWWSPAPLRPFLTPQLVCATTPLGAIDAATSAVTCTGVTAKATAAMGSCSCGTDGTNADQVSISLPVNRNPTTGVESACGAGTGFTCNTWTCVCTAGDGTAGLNPSTACVYCV